MQLNRKYYQELWEKYQNIETLTAKLNDNTSILTTKIILDQYKKKKPIHFNFESAHNSLHKIGQTLFIELANFIFHNEANFPELRKGDKLKSKYTIRVGTPKPRFLTFIIKRINNGKYILENSQFSMTSERSFSDIVQNFTPITQNAQNDTLTQYASFFEKLMANTFTILHQPILNASRFSLHRKHFTILLKSKTKFQQRTSLT